jgi:hypothetical protein
MLPLSTVPASKPPAAIVPVLPLAPALLTPAPPLKLAGSSEFEGAAARPPQPASCQKAVTVPKTNALHGLKPRPIL